MFDIFQLKSGLANTDYRRKDTTDADGVVTKHGIYDTYLPKKKMDEDTLNADDFLVDTDVTTAEVYEELFGFKPATGVDDAVPNESGTTTWDIYEPLLTWDTIASSIEDDKADLAVEKTDVERVLCSQV